MWFSNLISLSHFSPQTLQFGIEINSTTENGY